MAGIISFAAYRNLNKVASANKVFLSNPCLASLANNNGSLAKKQSPAASQAFIPAGYFSSTTSTLAQQAAVDCRGGKDYVKMWTLERALAIAMIPMTPAAFMYNIPGMDYIFATVFILHGHWGCESVIKDYIRPKIVGPVLAKSALVLMQLITAFTLGGIFYFNYTDVGVINAVKMFWKL